MASGQFPNLARWPLPYTSFEGRRRGRWLKHANTRRATVFIDLEVWPPDPVVLSDEFVSSFDVLPDGRLVVCSMLTQPESKYAIRIHPPGWPTEAGGGTAEVFPVPLPRGLCQVCTIGDRILAFDSLIAKDTPPASWRVCGLKGGRFRPVSELPVVERFGRGQLTHQVHDNGKVTLTDGTELLIWDGNGYELKRGRFERTWELSAKSSVSLGRWTAVPWGNDGFFYLSDRRVMYARRGAKPVRVMQDAENVMFLSLGPEDSVIASHGKNRKSLAARVWFPLDGSYIPVTRKELGIAPHFHPHEMYWSATTCQVYIKFGGLLTFPDSDLLALKRVRPRKGKYKVE